MPPSPPATPPQTLARQNQFSIHKISNFTELRGRERECACTGDEHLLAAQRVGDEEAAAAAPPDAVVKVRRGGCGGGGRGGGKGG